MAVVNKGIKQLPRNSIYSSKSPVIPDTDAPAKTETILLCLDGPGIADIALPYIENHISSLPPGIKAKVYLFQVITETTQYKVVDGAVTTTPYTEEEKRQIKNKAANYLSQIGEPLRNMGATVITKVVINTNVSREITNTAKKINASLIVMFSQKKSWLSRLLFGSVSDKVVRLEDRIPVTVIQAG
jgi:nucleotide-binding universal stress UspA family protein